MSHARHLLTAALLLALVATRAQEVTFSTPGGFYENAFELTLSCDQPDKVIHYTTNGNTPTAADAEYTAPLLLDENLYSRSDIYTIQNCPDELWFQPVSVKKCIVIRAAAFNGTGERIGEVVTNTYLIKSIGCDTHRLPVMSLCVDSLDLFDYELGILVPGINYDPDNPDYSGNYYMSGHEWERLCNVEYYEKKSHGINQQAGIRTQGLSTRRYPQKGLKIYAREEYGKKRFKYKFFEDCPVESFKHLKIKPFKAGWNEIGCEDFICGRIAQAMDIDYLASRPMVLFLNGEYWGIYYLQEKPDERYIEDHYGADLSTINILDSWDGRHYEYGTNEDFMALFDWIKDNDMSVEENYLYVAGQIDISNFIDYEIFEIFIANLDWPANNVRSWQAGEGLWRWLFFDGDGALFRPMAEFDAFANATYDGDEHYPSNRTSTLLFRQLMSNETFKLQFLNRFNQLLASVFNYKRTKAFYEEAYEAIEKEIPAQSDRFGNPESLSLWKKRMRSVDKFLSKRVDDVYASLYDYYLTNDANIVIDECFPMPASDELHVSVNVSTATLVDLEVFDVMGHRLYSTRRVFGVGSNSFVIPTNFRAGIYILRIGGISKKFVVIN